MVILHIANIANNPANGIHVAVPLHVKAQSELAQVCLVNYSNIDVEGVTQYEYKGAKNFPNYLPAPFNKPDIVVFHGVNLPKNISIYNKLIKKHIPYIIVPHGEITRTALKKKWLKKKIAYILLFNRFIKKAAAVQCLSQNEADESVIAKKKFIVPNGMDLHEQKPIHTEREGMKLLYIGRLEFEIKGFDLMVNAVASIAEYMRENKITIDIYGPSSGDGKDVLASYISAHNVADIVTVNAPVFGKEKADVINNYDVFIQTSRSEGMPMGILEALAYGMPVIATQGTRLMKQIAEHNCGYSAGGDVADIANAIKQAYNDKANWLEKGENARSLITNRFSWENVAKNAIGEYGRIAKQRS